MKEYIAVDLGASNGRTITGRFDGQKITLKELHRFENNYIRVGNAYYWDVLGLYKNILDGICIYSKSDKGGLCGIGIDTWAVDFGLIDAHGKIVGNPRAYRDPRNQSGMHAFHKKYGEKTLFNLTGIANLEFNTVYQLYDIARTNDPQLKIADKLLLMPDLLGYMLCGEMSAEYTNATTTQMLDSKTRQWSKEILDMIGVKEPLMASIQMSGEAKGSLLGVIQQDTGLKNKPPIYCVGSHDTASAVASVPAKGDNFAFLSSGTWSLIGVVSDNAIINDTVYTQRFSNEGTVEGTYRPLRNIMGLWILQNCKREWDREDKSSWNDIEKMAGQASAFLSFIDVNDHMFFDADDMPQKIIRYCQDTGQPVPQTKGEIARTVYESLAMSYREAFCGLEKIKGRDIDILHIVGGGAQNRMLNQFTANAINREVIAGPYEATAIGNLMAQVRASGEVKDKCEVRQVIRDSFDVESFEPRDTVIWTQHYNRYLRIKDQYKEMTCKD